MGRKNKSKRKESTASESHDETAPLSTSEPPAAPAPSPCAERTKECAVGRSGPTAERSTEAPTAPTSDISTAETNITPSTPVPEANPASNASETNTASTTPEVNPATATEVTEELRPADSTAPGLLRRIIRWIPIVGRYV